MKTIDPHYDLFVSHNREQKLWVREFVAFLRSLGFRVFFDEDSISPGEDFVLAIEHAVECSKAVLLVVSRAAMRSKWVGFEAALRLHEDPMGREKLLIPIITEPIAISEMRSSIRRLDAVNLTDPLTREAEFLHFLRCLGVSDERCRPITSWPMPVGAEQLHVSDVNSVVAAGWSGVELLERLVALDYQVFEDLAASHEGAPDQWAPVFMEHPETWRLLTTGEKEVGGYWHFVPLFEEDFELALQGYLLDSELTADRIRLFELPGWYDVYFVSIGIQPRFRRPRAIAQLFNSLLDSLDALARDGVYIRQVCANAYTRSGVALCRSLGMTEVGVHQEHGRIFLGTMANLLQQSSLASRHTVLQKYSAAIATGGNDVVAASEPEQG